MPKIHLTVIVEIHDDEILSTSFPAWQSEIPGVMGRPQGKAWETCVHCISLHFTVLQNEPPSSYLNCRNIVKDQSPEDVWVSVSDSGKHCKSFFFFQSSGGYKSFS